MVGDCESPSVFSWRACSGPVLWKLGRSEVARWYQAAALEQELEGNLEQAVACLDKALEWDSENAEIFSQRSGLRLRQGNANAAVPDAERATELSRAAYQGRATPDNFAILMMSLNQLAYTYALQGENLEEGLELIDEFFEKTGAQDPSYLDTRGYLRYLTGDKAGALQDMEATVALAEGNRVRQLLEIRRDAKMRVDRRMSVMRERMLTESLAVFYHHRGLVYEAIGKKNAAAQD